MILSLLQRRVFYFYYFSFQIILLIHSLIYADMASEGKTKFVEVVHTARKGETIAGTSGSPPKWARQAEEIIILPFLLLHLQ